VGTTLPTKLHAYSMHTCNNAWANVCHIGHNCYSIVYSWLVSSNSVSRKEHTDFIVTTCIYGRCIYNIIIVSYYHSWGDLYRSKCILFHDHRGQIVQYNDSYYNTIYDNDDDHMMMILMMMILMMMIISW
jgi:hypothetical protein